MLSALVLVPAIAQDAFISNVSIREYMPAGVSLPISVKVENASATYVTSFSVRYRLDGGSWANGTTVNITPPGLQSNGYSVNYPHPSPINVTFGAHTLEVNVVMANDVDQTNNTVLINFAALNDYGPKVPLLECNTETWCPNCPPVNVITNGMISDPDHALVKFHMSDALNDCEECTDYFQQYNSTSTPTAMIEMGDFGNEELNLFASGWQAELEERALGISPLILTMTSSVNPTTRVVTVGLNATFTYPVTGPFRLNVYVAEDNVPGPQQSAAANYIHQRVMRAMLGGMEGSTAVIPTNPVLGTTYSQTYSYSVPADYEIEELHLVGVCERRPDGTFAGRGAMNCVNRSLGAVSVDELSLSDNGLVAFPNPFSSDLRVRTLDFSGNARVELIGMDGRIVFEDNLIMARGVASLVDIGGAAVPNGAYVLRLRTNEGTAEQRIVKMD